MKRLFIVASLALVASTGMATVSQAAGAFGLFYSSRGCSGCCIRPYNAFTPIACGDMHYCPVPIAAGPPPQAFSPGACMSTSFGPGGIRCGGLFNGLFHRGCKGGSCDAGGCGSAGHVAGDLGLPTGNMVASETPPTQPALQTSPRNLTPYWTANMTPQQMPAYQPVSTQGAYGYGMMPAMPMMPTWGGYGYGYYPAYPQPMYNTGMWGYPTGR
jgi:hypothetical protein